MIRQADAYADRLWTSVSTLSRRLLHSSYAIVRALCLVLCQPLRWLIGGCIVVGLVTAICALLVWFVLLDMMHDITGRLDNR